MSWCGIEGARKGKCPDHRRGARSSCGFDPATVPLWGQGAVTQSEAVTHIHFPCLELPILVALSQQNCDANLLEEFVAMAALGWQLANQATTL